MDDPAYQATCLGAAYESIVRLPVVVCLENIRSLYNVGSFFRTADAVRVERLCLAGITDGPGDLRIAKTALGAERTVPAERIDDMAGTLKRMRDGGYQLAAIETSLRAVDLFEWVPAWPVCVVFGHEVEGVTPAVLEMCDVHVRIPTLGLKQSINVATAGGVVLFELLRKRKGAAGPAP